MRYESFYPFTGNQPPPAARAQPIQYGYPGQQYADPVMQYTNQGMQQRRAYPVNQMENPYGSPAQGQQQDGSKMEMYMQTANRFLSTAQQFAPLVQQMAPMVQNLPAMWRLYKGFQSLPSAGAGPAAAPTVPTGVPPAGTPLGQSNPRIFQPPN